MAKRESWTRIWVTVGGQQSYAEIGEVLDFKGWPPVAMRKATWSQLREAAKELLEEEAMLSAEHDEYSWCDEGAIEEMDLIAARNGR